MDKNTKYDIKFDRSNSNSIIIKKDGKIIKIIAIPPNNMGCDVIDFNGEIHKGYNYNSDVLIIINKPLGKLMFLKGELLDHIIFRK